MYLIFFVGLSFCEKICFDFFCYLLNENHEYTPGKTPLLAQLWLLVITDIDKDICTPQPTYSKILKFTQLTSILIGF